MEDIKHNDWSGKTGGSSLMQRSLILLINLFGLRFMYVIMGFVVPFYMLFSHKGYISMYHFFRNKFLFSPLKSFRYVYLNHLSFGQVILDRFAAYGGKKFDFELVGNENFMDLVSKEGGFVQLSSHVGNFEMAGYSLNPEKKVIYAPVFSKETKTVMENRQKVFSNNNIVMVPVIGDMSHIFQLNSALSEGNIVSMDGDRLLGSGKSLECNFFGAKSKFPMGPFALAVQREVPVLSIFVMKESVKRYKIYVSRVEQLESELVKPHREQMFSMAQEFASKLEKIVRMYPRQWFNYYEF